MDLIFVSLLLFYSPASLKDAAQWEDCKHNLRCVHFTPNKWFDDKVKRGINVSNHVTLLAILPQSQFSIINQVSETLNVKLPK